MGGGEKLKVKIRKLTIKLEVTCIYKPQPPPPTRHNSKIFMILTFFSLIFFACRLFSPFSKAMLCT